MRVKDMRNKIEEVTFDSIGTGECFIDWEGALCMKMADNDHYNAITLASGLPWISDLDAPVTPVQTHIVIESEE
jgi:hypothetical protein